MPLGAPIGNIYGSVPDEHLPWGADTSHNLFPMALPPVSKNDGPLRPQRLVVKQQYTGNPLAIFKSRTKIQSSTPQPF